MLKEAIQQLLHRQPLSQEQLKTAILAVLDPNENPLQIAAFLALLHAKPETLDELMIFIEMLRLRMLSLPIEHPVLDIVGTGGDGAQTVNISTGSAILAASLGIPVVKHGNRRVSSLSGAADVLEALGIKIDITVKKTKQIFKKLGITFCYFPTFHPDTVPLRNLRQKLAIPTTFNQLGPFLNPAPHTHFILGVAALSSLPTMASLLKRVTKQKSLIVHSQGLDEISTLGVSNIIEIEGESIKNDTLCPTQLGFSTCTLKDLQGGDPKTNAKRLLDVFHGQQNPLGETLILNAAIALYLYGKTPDIKEGIPIVKQALSQGKPSALIKQWRELSHA